MSGTPKQSASVRDAKRYLAQAVAAEREAKKIISFITREGRILMDEKEFHELQNLVLLAGSDFATMDSHLGSYGRLGPNSKRFAVVKQ